MIREEIIKLIKSSIITLQGKGEIKKFEVPNILIEKPELESRGDYASNIGLTIAKTVERGPMEISELIKEGIQNEAFEKIEVVKPGFINFFVSRSYLQKQIEEILKQKGRFGNLDVGKGKKVQVEFISANPTGPLTVGNARGGPFGDTLGNVFKKAGFDVEKAYYINNYGKQILILGHSVLKDEEAQYKGEYIDYLNKKIKGKDPRKVGERAAKIIVEEMMKKTVRKMGIDYDEWFSEKTLYESGKVDDVIELLKKKNLVYEKEDALWFKSSQYGDERDRVIVKADGTKTYLAGDVAYHRYKFEDKKFDKVVNVWGADHYGDVVGLQGAVEALGHKGKLDIVLLQFVTLFEKGKKLKMSKREGTYVTIDELLDKVGLDVVRFFFLSRSANTHLEFDLSLAKEESNRNPVYYVQYAYARICSILKKAKIDESEIRGASKNLKLLRHSSELTLIKKLVEFPEVIEDIIDDYQVQKLPRYSIELAESFHKFYRDCKVIVEDDDLRKARLALILAVKIVLKETLDLIGIAAPEKM